MAELASFAVLSTATLTPQISDMLDEMGEHVDAPSRWGDWRDDINRCGYAFGHWVSVIASRDETAAFERRISRLPDCLKDGMRHAREFGAAWILYDRDADVHDLPEYDWEPQAQTPGHVAAEPTGSPRA